MAGPRVRKFYVVPGKIDPQSGRPIEYTTLADARSQAGGFAGIGEKTPVEVTETMTEDGEYTQTIQGPDGQPQVIDQGVDSKQTALASERRQTAAAAGKAETPEDASVRRRTEAAQASSAEAAAAKAVRPETITRARPDAGLLDTGVSATEQVTKAQADYDRQVKDDQRQAQLDLQQRAEKAEADVIARARLGIEQDRLTADQAHQRVQEDLSRIQAEVAREANAISQRGQELSAETARRGQDISAATAQRGQDISLQTSREGNQVSLRGQDISAGVSQRGQDLGYEQSLVGDTVQMANTIASHSAPLWQIAQVDAATRGGWGAAIPPMQATPPQFGNDPAAFVGRAADEARRRRPPPLMLPGADQYRLPG